jgi:hypothetical protein
VTSAHDRAARAVGVAVVGVVLAVAAHGADGAAATIPAAFACALIATAAGATVDANGWTWLRLIGALEAIQALVPRPETQES